MRYYFFFIAVLMTAPLLGALLKGYFTAIRVTLNALRLVFIRFLARRGSAQENALVASGMRAEDLPPSLQAVDNAALTATPAESDIASVAPGLSRWLAIQSRMSSWQASSVRLAADLLERWHTVREHARYARTHYVVMASSGHVYAPVRFAEAPMAVRMPKRRVKAIQLLRRSGT